MFATSAHRDILMVLCRLTRYGLAIVTAVMYWLWEIVLCLIKASFYTVVGMVRALLPSCHSKLPDFSADVCLVTGAAQGLGRQLALKFAECGATLVLWDINEEKVFAVAEEVRALGNEAFAYVCDCSKREEIYRVAERVRREVGDVAILVNNAGVVSGKRLLENSDADIEKTFQVNTLSHYWTVKSFLPWMMDNDYGYIVQISSVLSFMGVAGLSDYCASKSAVLTFSESLRSELTTANKKGITVTCVCPYHISNTGMFGSIRTRFPRLFPSVRVEDVAKRVIKAVRDKQFLVVTPRHFYFTSFFKSFTPTKGLDQLLDISGANSAMDDFNKQKKED